MTEIIGILIIVLLTLLIASVSFATFVLWKRMQQMKEFQAKMEQESEEEKESEVVVPSPPMFKLGVKPPVKEPNEKLVSIESKLDKLYEDMERDRTKLPGESWEKRENELISKMVDFFIKEADRRLLSEYKSHHSGSH